ncbi:hypothetical protein [Streptomyces sp. NPDC050504]|uniref:hypothetical protein n=1 Tax=Streptomyces sp. NPDC050504 TaxID=3365618 RepID=UPI00378747F9
MRGLTAGTPDGADGSDEGRRAGTGSDGGRSGDSGDETDPGGRRARRARPGRGTWAASGTALAGLAALGLFAASCSTGGTGTRDEGRVRTGDIVRASPLPDASATAKPKRKVDAVRLIMNDPKVSAQVKDDLKPCVADAYPIDTMYGNLTGGPSADVVVNVMTCGDAIGLGTYVYRGDGDKYDNVFAAEAPAVYGIIDRGDLVVTTSVYKENDQVASPSGEEAITYRWSGDRFVVRDRVSSEFSRAVGDDGGGDGDAEPKAEKREAGHEPGTVRPTGAPSTAPLAPTATAPATAPPTAPTKN